MSLDPAVVTQVRQVTGTAVRAVRGLGGGCISKVMRIDLEDGGAIIAKRDISGLDLTREAYMLGYLRAHSGLPIPDVLFASHDLLLLTLIDDDGELSPTAEENAADYIAALHEIRGPTHGFERDTPIGRVNQPNPWSDSWLSFFAEHRLMAMASVANSHGILPLELLRGIETVAGRLPGLTFPRD